MDLLKLLGIKYHSRSLRGRVLREGAFLTVGNVAEQLFRFSRNILLTHILAPEVFGMMAIVLSISSALESFTEIGVKEAVIQNPRASERRYINAAWWLAVGRSLCLYAAIFLAAPFVAEFYKKPELTALLRTALAGVLFVGFMSSGAFLALKEMRFRRWAIIWHGGGIIGVITAVILALVIRNVWALVFGFLAENVVRWCASYLLCPFRPRLGWDGSCARELLTFSRRVFGLPVLNFIFMRTDIFVLGKMKSGTILGLYAMGIYLAQVPAGFLMNLLGQILLPTLSELDGQKERVRRILLQVTSLLISLSLPLLVFVFAYGRSLLTVVYGRAYASVSVALSLAAAMSVMNIVNGQITTVFYASGDPQLHRRSVLITASTMVALVYPLIKTFGLNGAPLASLIAIAAGYVFQLMRVRRLIDLDIIDYFKRFVPGVAASFVVVLFYLGTTQVVRLSAPQMNLAAGGFACILAYSVFFAIFMRRKKSSAALENVLP